jgi:hypothetical protein
VEAVTYLRLDSALDALAPGGIYAFGALAEPGITDAITTPDVWSGGVFRTTVVVRQRLPVPDYRVQDEAQQIVAQMQSLEVYGYALTQDAVEAALGRVYSLVQGYQFSGAWAAIWFGSVAFMRPPELPNIWMSRRDYRVISLATA